jgi:hypothetical protein
MTDTFRARAALAEQPVGLTDEEIEDLADFDAGFDRYDTKDESGNEGIAWECSNSQLLAFARALLTRWGTPAIEPVVTTDEELVNFRNRATADCCASRSNNGADLLSSDDLVACQAAGLRAVLARWGQPAQPVGEGPLKERPDFIAGYREGLADRRRIIEHEEAERPAALAEQPVGPEVEPTLREEFTMILNEARCNSPSRVIGNIELGRRLAAVVEQFKHPTPIPVAERLPGAAEQALIKAECALSDIAEGEAEESEGDPLEWAEKRAAGALARIRPVMREYQICTSEWPPLPAHAIPMTNLSPAAQAIFWAFNSKFSWIEDGVPGPQFKAIAAALRAAADQVALMRPHGGRAWTVEQATAYDALTKAFDLLNTIADELEVQ